MPDAGHILEDLQAIVAQGKSASPIIRVMILALVGFFLAKRRIVPAFLAAAVATVIVAASIMAVAFEEHETLFIFFVLFPLGVLWGWQGLILPGRAPGSPWRAALACVVGLGAFFYPHFVEGVAGAVLFSPVGVVPCPTLILAVAATIAAGRSFNLYTVAATWAVAALFGGIGVFFLAVNADWWLIASVPVGIASYVVARPASTSKRRRARRKR